MSSIPRLFAARSIFRVETPLRQAYWMTSTTASSTNFCVIHCSIDSSGSSSAMNSSSLLSRNVVS
jgi:hypothetical protein